MNLMTVKKDAQEIATSISEIMGVDVVIVDSDLQRIADTFHYPYRSIDIQTTSIIGRILKTGRPLVVDNKDFFQSCADCKDRVWCRMQGLMGVPILFQGKTMGAIGLVVEENNVRHLVENTNLVLTFLQQMADLLSGKLAEAENYNSIQQMSSRWEYMLNTVDAGVVLLDGSNSIIVHNEHFCRIFGIEGECYNHQLTEYISHPVITDILRKRLDVAGQALVVPLENSVFYGRVQVKQMWQNGICRGAVFSFQDWYHAFPEEVSFVGNRCGRQSLKELCTESGLFAKLSQAARNEPAPILLCGSRESLRYLHSLAAAIHVHSGREGKCNYVSSEDWIDFVPLTFDLSDVAKVPPAVLISHQGTLCISQVFDLPVSQQRSLLDYVRKCRSREKLGFCTRLIFLAAGDLPDAESRFICRELLEELLPYKIQVPNPLHCSKHLRRQLERYFADYAECYHTGQLEVEMEVWDILLGFPWKQSNYPLYKIVECLVRDSGGKVRAEQARQLLEELNVLPRSVEGFEQEQIRRLLNEGASVEQIANILKISRSTLYRRIKKYKLIDKENEL